MTSLKTVAFLTYFFPPIGGGGTPRTVKFVKYLPMFGYRAVVLAVEVTGPEFSREFQRDESPLRELDPETYDVIRVPDPTRTGYRKKLLASSVFPFAWALGYPWLYDQQRPWAYRAADALLRSELRQNVRLVYVSAAPVAGLEAGRWLARKLGVPWVADLRDLWTPDTFRSYPSRLHYLWAQRLERKVLRTAGKIIANTPLSALRIRSLVGRDAAEKVRFIPNGFDPAEVKSPVSLLRRPDDAITIVHAGTVYDPGVRKSRPGRYFPYALDDTARSPIPLARALAQIVATSPALASRINVRLVGYVPDRARQAIEDIGVNSMFTFRGTVPRSTAVAEENAADALLVLQMAWDEPGRPMPYVPGKVYEALATKAPILAPIGPGDLQDLLRQTPQAYVCDYKSPADIARTVRRLIADIDARQVRASDPLWVSQYDRRLLTGTLAREFDGLVNAADGRPSET